MFFFKDSQRARYIFSVKKCCTFGSFIIDTPPHDFRQYCTLASHLILVDIKTSVSKSFSNTVALKKKNKTTNKKTPISLSQHDATSSQQDYSWPANHFNKEVNKDQRLAKNISSLVFGENKAAWLYSSFSVNIMTENVCWNYLKNQNSRICDCDSEIIRTFAKKIFNSLERIHYQS